MSPNKRYYTVTEKLAIVEAMNKHKQTEENISFRPIARDLGVDPSQLRRWEQQSTKLKNLV